MGRFRGRLGKTADADAEKPAKAQVHLAHGRSPVKTHMLASGRETKWGTLARKASYLLAICRLSEIDGMKRMVRMFSWGEQYQAAKWIPARTQPTGNPRWRATLRRWTVGSFQGGK